MSVDAEYRTRLVDAVQERVESMRELAEELAQVSGAQVDRMFVEKVRASCHEVTAAMYAWALQDLDTH